ncbi:hypothetical protein ACJX0J_011964, partial [Zea mays]
TEIEQQNSRQGHIMEHKKFQTTLTTHDFTHILNHYWAHKYQIHVHYVIYLLWMRLTYQFVVQITNKCTSTFTSEFLDYMT